MVYDLREQPAKELVASGAKVAASPREVAAYGEIVQIAVRDGIQVEALVLGEGGVLEAMNPGSAIAIHSTIHPKIVKKIGESAMARRVGVIDAAISGGESGARGARLAYMVGGDKEWVEKCRPVLAASGENIFHVGELGKGLAAKLCHQLILCINMISVYEGIGWLKRRVSMRSFFKKSFISAQRKVSVMDHWQRYNRSYDTVPPGYALFYKDLGVVLEFAHDLGISLPGAGLVQQMINPVLGIRSSNKGGSRPELPKRNRSLEQAMDKLFWLRAIPLPRRSEKPDRIEKTHAYGKPYCCQAAKTLGGYQAMVVDGVLAGPYAPPQRAQRRCNWPSSQNRRRRNASASWKHRQRKRDG